MHECGVGCTRASCSYSSLDETEEELSPVPTPSATTAYSNWGSGGPAAAASAAAQRLPDASGADDSVAALQTEEAALLLRRQVSLKPYTMLASNESSNNYITTK